MKHSEIPASLCNKDPKNLNVLPSQTQEFKLDERTQKKAKFEASLDQESVVHRSTFFSSSMPEGTICCGRSLFRSEQLTNVNHLKSGTSTHTGASRPRVHEERRSRQRTALSSSITSASAAARSVGRDSAAHPSRPLHASLSGAARYRFGGKTSASSRSLFLAVCHLAAVRRTATFSSNFLLETPAHSNERNQHLRAQSVGPHADDAEATE